MGGRKKENEGLRLSSRVQIFQIVYLLVDGSLRPQEGSLLIEAVASPGDEGGRNQKAITFDERWGAGVPGSIGCCFVCGTKRSRREGRSVRLSLEELVAVEVNDHVASLVVKINEAVMLWVENERRKRRD